MAEYEEKFIVINRKHLGELNSVIGGETSDGWNGFSPAKAVLNLLGTIEEFTEVYEANVKKKLNQRYYICNQDEPYAQEVIDIILAGEETKNIKK